MKFGHELLALEAGCPEEFSGRFLKYKQLKKLIKRIREVEEEGSLDSPEEREFLNLLNAEVSAVNRTFEQHAQQVVHMAASKRRRRRGCCLPAFRKSSGLKEEELARHAQWCRRFATVNATGLRKIAKKHDKYARNSAGQQFLQACWDCRNRELGAFLHSPLIDELRALEALSEAHRTSDAADVSGGSRGGASAAVAADAAAAAPTPPQAFAPAAAGPSHPHGCTRDAEMEGAPPSFRRSLRLPDATSSDAAMASADDSPRSGDSAESSSFRCAICLAPMWMPVGLSCGHIFCTECVFHAVGIMSWMRPLQEVLADVQPTATCPKCRQRYVFREVIQLKELGAVIRFKYPDEVGQRAAEVAAELEAKRKEKKAAAASRRRSRLSELMEPFPRGL